MLSEDPAFRPTAAKLRRLWPLSEHSDTHYSHSSYTKPVHETTNVYQMLLNRKDIIDNMCTMMAVYPHIQYLINKKSLRHLKKSYFEGLKKFASTLFFVSPETYVEIRKTFGLRLRDPGTIWKWFLQPRGRPGISEDTLNVIKTWTKETLGCLLVYELKIREGIEKTINDNLTYYGYADVGNNLQGNGIQRANEVLVIMAVSFTSRTILPIGNFFGKHFTPSQKGTLVKLCIDSLSTTKLRIISVTLKGNVSNFNLARSLGANIDTPPFTPYFEYMDKRYYLIIDPKHLFTQEKLFMERNKAQISLWNRSEELCLERNRTNVKPLMLNSSHINIDILVVCELLFRIYSRKSINLQNYQDFCDKCHELEKIMLEYQATPKIIPMYIKGDFNVNFALSAISCNLNVLWYLSTDYIETGKLKHLPLSKLVLRDYNNIFYNDNFTASSWSSVYKNLVEQTKKKMFDALS